TWSTATTSASSLDTRPSIAIDAAGRSHVLFSRNAPYSICQDPLCPSAPGLRYWSDTPGFGAVRRVTDNTDDALPVVVRGLDGSISGAFTDVDWRLAEIRLVRALPKASAPAAHLAGAGTTLAQKTAALSVGLAGSGATAYR